MQTQPTTFETVLDLVKQLSLADQVRLIEWITARMKQKLAVTSSPEASKHYLTGRELAQIGSDFPEAINRLGGYCVWIDRFREVRPGVQCV